MLGLKKPGQVSPWQGSVDRAVGDRCNRNVPVCREAVSRRAVSCSLAGFGKLAAACVSLSLLLAVPAAFADRQKGWSWRLTDAQREVRDKHRYGGAVCVEDGASQCAFGDLRRPLGVFLVGDSYMEHLIPAFVSVAQQLQMRG